MENKEKLREPKKIDMSLYTTGCDPHDEFQKELSRVVWSVTSEETETRNFYEDLVKYFETTPREKVLEDWNKSAHLDNVGPTVDELQILCDTCHNKKTNLERTTKIKKI